VTATHIVNRLLRAVFPIPLMKLFELSIWTKVQLCAFIFSSCCLYL